MVLRERVESKVDVSEITAAEAHHWPIVRSFMDRIDLVKIVNQLVPTQMAVEPGLIVKGLVIDTLSGRSPLYHLESSFEHADRELLFGEDVPASYFNDDNVARTLDQLYAVGTQKIFSTLSVAAVQAFGIETHHAHYDTTSVSVYGEYTQGDETNTDGVVRITYGHSKDKRPDLKQFLLSTLCVGGDVPILGSVEDGNASDKTLNRGILNQVSSRMAALGVDEGAFVYMADSAMVTASNLAEIGDRIAFITRLPATYHECERVIREAVGTNAWETLGPLAQSTPTKNRPLAIYRAHESTVTLYDKRYRAVVIHSSSHDKRRNKKLDRDIQSSEKVLLQQAKERAKPVYACRADADAAAKAAGQEKTRYHRLEVSVQKHLQYAKGRPKKELPRTPIGGHYQLTLRVVENTKAIEIGRQVAGCFVMLTNIPVDGKQGYDSTKILRTYKDQQGVERNFSFLKDDQIVNALFLKRRDRIEVLGLILLMALLIWRLMEHQMRGHLQHHETTVPGWDNKPTQRPTAYMLTIKFKGILILRVGHQRTLAQPLCETQNAFLKALELPSTVFIQPPDTR